MESVYKANWGKPLAGISIGGTVVCVAVSGSAFFATRGGGAAWYGMLPLLVPLAAVPFAIRGYEVNADWIGIRRLFWTTRIPRAGLESAEMVPGAMSGSVRTFGNGGLFSFTGWYSNRELGNYRAFVTDLQATVVLKIGRKTVVVSPDRPEDLVKELQAS